MCYNCYAASVICYNSSLSYIAYIVCYSRYTICCILQFQLACIECYSCYTASVVYYTPGCLYCILQSLHCQFMLVVTLSVYVTVVTLSVYVTIVTLSVYITVVTLSVYVTVVTLSVYVTVVTLSVYVTAPASGMTASSPMVSEYTMDGASHTYNIAAAKLTEDVSVYVIPSSSTPLAHSVQCVPLLSTELDRSCACLSNVCQVICFSCFISWLTEVSIARPPDVVLTRLTFSKVGIRSIKC